MEVTRIPTRKIVKSDDLGGTGLGLVWTEVGGPGFSVLVFQNNLTM